MSADPRSANNHFWDEESLGNELWSAYRMDGCGLTGDLWRHSVENTHQQKECCPLLALIVGDGVERIYISSKLNLNLVVQWTLDTGPNDPMRSQQAVLTKDPLLQTQLVHCYQRLVRKHAPCRSFPLSSRRGLISPYFSAVPHWLSSWHLTSWFETPLFPSLLSPPWPCSLQGSVPPAACICFQYQKWRRDEGWHLCVKDRQGLR